MSGGQVPVAAGVAWRVPHGAAGAHIPAGIAAPAGILLAAAAPGTCCWHLVLHKEPGWCVDKVPAVPFSGPFPALPGPEDKHSWHICHVRLNTASFRKEKKNQIKENPVLPLLPLTFFYT